jgi:polyvinyl alcohol dehydrogenase (cytochrome)
MKRRPRLLTSAAAAALAAGLLVPSVTNAAPACADDSQQPGGLHPGGDWRMFGHDYANTRSQPAETTIGRLQAPLLAPAWTFSSTAADGGGDFTGTPTVADGCVYVGSNEGWVFAINADTGDLVWKAPVPAGGGINSSVTVPGDGRVYAAVSHATRAACTGEQCEGPYVIALDQADGHLVWQSSWDRGAGVVPQVIQVIDTQPGADVYGSPMIFDGLVFEGVSGGSAELGDESDRYAFQGSFVILDAATGAVLKKTWVIHPPNQPNDDFAGAGVWSTPSIDPATKTAYVGTANPFKPQAQHENADAVIKVDLNKASPTFGSILGRYAGTIEEYVPAFSKMPCVDTPGNPPPYYPQGLGSCADADLDFGAAPNLFTDVAGKLMVGAGQKSGVYHAFDAATLKQAWSSIVGPPTSVGGIVGSTAYDGSAFYGPITVGGYLWSIAKDNGLLRWLGPVADGAHWGEPVAVANGVVYTVTLTGFLDAFDAQTGVPLLMRPIAAGSGTGGDPVASWGGVSVARNTVYAAVGITGLPNGFVVAFRPGGGEGGGPGPGPEPPPLPDGVRPTVYAGPGGYLTTYLTPIMLVRAGNEVLDFTNFDLQRHDVDHIPTSGPQLFESDLAANNETVQVRFHGHLERGKNYDFYCTLHPGMFGKIVAY